MQKRGRDWFVGVDWASQTHHVFVIDAVLGSGDELGVYAVPGDGSVDRAAVFSALGGCPGWVVLEAEQDPDKAPALDDAECGVVHIRAALREAGLS